MKKGTIGILIKKAEDVFPILTALTTFVVFLIRAYGYMYEWGYVKSLGVSRVYIDVDSGGGLYYLIAHIGLALLVILLNCCIYILWKNKKIVISIVVILLESLSIMAYVFAVANIGIVDQIKMLFENFNYFAWVFTRLLFVAIILNVYGIFFAIIDRRFPKEKTAIKRAKNPLGNVGVHYWVIGGVFFVILSGIMFYWLGIDAGNNKTDFKVIIENVDKQDGQKDSKSYVFKLENESVKVYPILYETKDSYIVSYLYSDSEHPKPIIENERQRIISKENVDIKAYEDIYSIFKTENNKNVRVNKNKVQKGENSLGETVISGFLGAVVGGICTYLVEKGKRKEETKKLERHAASILYYDLKSLEKYFRETEENVNLRYSSDWQTMLSNCSFLTEENVMYLYKIYDEAYNYNIAFDLVDIRNKRFKKEKMMEYKKLKRLIFKKVKGKDVEKIYRPEYERILSILEKAK